MNTATPVYASLGSISHGTMRAEDLIPAFLDCLDNLREELTFSRGDVKNEVGRLDSLMGEIEQRMFTDDGTDTIDAYFESESADYDLESLFDELNTFAPPYAYFGSSEGDGSDYGFWLSYESIDDAVCNGELIKLDSGDEWPADELAERPDVEGVLYVSDHGNMTLHGVDGKEIWSVV